MYEVPSFGGGVAGAILSGWRFSALETLQSGPPFTVITAANTTNAFPAGPLRPNLVGNPELPSDQRTLSRWFNTAAFANPANFTFGNSPRSVLRGPRSRRSMRRSRRAFRFMPALNSICVPRRTTS